MKVKIISDSTCDLSAELIEKYDIEILPLAVSLGDRLGKDGVDITPEDIYSYVSESGNLPKTSALNVADYEEAFRKWADQGYGIVHFNISSGFSCSHQNALIAAQEFDNVFVVDSKNLSTGQGLAVIHGAIMAQNGCSAEEIYNSCTELTSKVEASFVVDKLDYLHKGGRCSAVAALGANLLKLKPCIEVRNGSMEVGKKYRGKIGAVMLDYVTERLSGRDDLCLDRIFLTHTKCDPADIEAVRLKIEELQPGFKEILETVAGSTITTHCGPGTMGILFVRK